MNKKTLFVIILSLSLLFLGVMIKLDVDKKERNAINRSILLEISNYDKGITKCINFNKINYVQWDRLYIFNPYSTSEEIESKIGTFWLDGRMTKISSNDNIALLLFMEGNSVRQYVEFYRGNGDFTSFENGLSYKKNQAFFVQDKVGHFIPMKCESGNCCE